MRYLPAVVFFLALVHVIHLRCGINSPVFEIAEVAIGFYLVHKLSAELGFCILHRMMIYYSALVMGCTYCQRIFGFGRLRDVAQIIVASIGIILAIYIIISWTKTLKN